MFASSGKASGLHPDITGSLSGVESIDNAFKELDADIRKRMLSKAMRKAHKPFKDEISAVRLRVRQANCVLLL